MIVRIPFNLIRVNQGREGLEVVFPYGEDWYRLDWDATGNLQEVRRT